MTSLDVFDDAAVADRLGRVFGMWRLRPGEVEQDAFQAVCARLSEAVAPRAGLVLAVHGASFVTADDVRVDGNAAGALAESLYRLGIEWLRVHRPPTPSQLDRFLCAVQVAGDREDLLGRLGPVAEVLEPLGVAPAATAAEAPEELPGWEQTWDRLADPVDWAREVSSTGPTDAAAVLLRIVALRDGLPEERRRSPVLADRLQTAIVSLPTPLRTEVARALVAAPDDPFAGWLLCSLTDHDLGRLLEGVAEDVPALARHALGRELVDLSAEVEVAAAAAPPVGSEDGSGEHWAPSVGGAPMGVASLELFLVAERRPHRLRTALLHWQRRARAAIHAGELETVHELLSVLHRVVALSEQDITAVLDAACVQALGPDEVGALLPPAGEALPGPTLELLQAFGPVAVDAILGRLVSEEDQQLRAQLVSVLAGLIPGNTGALRRWLDDPRWFVVRNVVTALWRSADPSGMPLVDHATAHPDPRVRLEAARALAALGGVAPLAMLAADDDAEVRTSARRLLGGLGSPEAAEALGTVTTDARVPLVDRRAALDTLAQHPRGASTLRRLSDPGELPLRLRRHAARLSAGGTP